MEKEKHNESSMTIHLSLVLQKNIQLSQQLSQTTQRLNTTIEELNCTKENVLECSQQQKHCTEISARVELIETKLDEQMCQTKTEFIEIVSEAKNSFQMQLKNTEKDLNATNKKVEVTTSRIENVNKKLKTLDTKMGQHINQANRADNNLRKTTQKLNERLTKINQNLDLSIKNHNALHDQVKDLETNIQQSKTEIGKCRKFCCFIALKKYFSHSFLENAANLFTEKDNTFKEFFSDDLVHFGTQHENQELCKSLSESRKEYLYNTFQHSYFPASFSERYGRLISLMKPYKFYNLADELFLTIDFRDKKKMDIYIDPVFENSNKSQSDVIAISEDIKVLSFPSFWYTYINIPCQGWTLENTDVYLITKNGIEIDFGESEYGNFRELEGEECVDAYDKIALFKFV